MNAKIKILLLFLTLNCAVTVTDNTAQSVEYKPPEHKHVLMMTRKGLYSAALKDLTTWKRIYLSYPSNFVNDKPFSTFGSNYNNFGSVDRIENFMDITYCRGLWVAVAKISKITDLGTSGVKKAAIYWSDRQDPNNAEWNRYEISVGSPHPVSLSCNTLSGVFTLANWENILTSSNPKEPKAWLSERVNDKFGVPSNRVLQKAFNFLESTYLFLGDSFGNTGYLALKLPDKKWKVKNIQKEFGAKEGGLLKSMVFDPTTNKLIFATDTAENNYILLCGVNTLDCSTVSISRGVEAMATDFKNSFFGVSFTNAWVWKTPNTGGKFVSGAKSGLWLFKPKNAWTLLPPSLASITYLKDRWFVGGFHGTLFYTEPNTEIYGDYSKRKYTFCGLDGVVNPARPHTTLIIGRDRCLWKEAHNLGDASSAADNNPLKVSKHFGRGKIHKLVSGGL